MTRSAGSPEFGMRFPTSPNGVYQKPSLANVQSWMHSKMKVELVYENACPNVALARSRLLEAFRLVGLSPHWLEWDVNRTETPETLRQFGSPSILVDGKDVSDSRGRNDGSSCRLYAQGGRIENAPAVTEIASALCAAEGRGPRTYSTGGAGLASLPSIAVALMPKLTCPICWPAYTALLSSVGVSFVKYTPIPMPVLAFLLVVTLVTMAYAARSRRGFGPFWLGLIASLTILLATFVLDDDLAIYLGSGLLVGASVWNIWPRKRASWVDSHAINVVLGEDDDLKTHH